MFRGKESSNRIELSRLVQDLLNFGVSGSLPLWGWGGGWMGVGVGGWVDGGGGGWGYPLHMCTCTRMHAHACMVNMIISCKWPPPLGEYLGIPYDVIHAYVHVHVHACAYMCMWVGCTLSSPPTPIHPPPTPQGDPWNHSKFNSTWTNQDISILFEDLKSVETSPPMGGCIIWWVGGWVGGLMGGVRSNH